MNDAKTILSFSKNNLVKNYVYIAIVAAISVAIIATIIIIYFYNNTEITSTPLTIVQTAATSNIIPTRPLIQAIDWSNIKKYQLQASQISISTCHPAFCDPNVLIDGDIQQVGIHTLDSGIITVKLPFNIPISKLVLYNRPDCCQDRMTGCTIKIFDDKGLLLMTKILHSNEMIISVPIRVIGAKITLQQPGGDGILNIAEFELWTIA